MTISQYVEIARQPWIYTDTELCDAHRFWNKRAFTAPTDDMMTVALIWRRMCAEALSARGSTVGRRQ